MNAGVTDTSVFVAIEGNRPIGRLPDAFVVSVVTLAELETGVFRARDAATQVQRMATLARVRRDAPAVPITEDIASIFAGLVAAIRETGSRPKVQDTWIAATALHLSLPVYTQDDDFDAIPRVEVVRV